KGRSSRSCPFFCAFLCQERWRCPAFPVFAGFCSCMPLGYRYAPTIQGIMQGNSDHDLAARLAAAFPNNETVPAEFRPNPAAYEKLYLQDGVVREWPGPFTEVSSPICLNENGRLQRPVLGHVPSMDEEAAMAGLKAAVRAWDNGRGE